MASLGDADGFVLSRADGNGGGGVRSVDAVDHRSLILILVAVNETIEDVITTGASGSKALCASSAAFESHSSKRLPPAARTSLPFLPSLLALAGNADPSTSRTRSSLLRAGATWPRSSCMCRSAGRRSRAWSRASPRRTPAPNRRFGHRQSKPATSSFAGCSETDSWASC